MKEKLLTTIAFLLTGMYSFSQEGIPEFGNISVAELSSTTCGFEQDPPAVYLLNYAKTTFETYYDGSSDIVTKRRIRIKIINQRGFDYASISIPHLGNKHTSKIKDVEAFIYSLDAGGNIVKTKVERKDIFRENLSKNSELNTVKFTFPGLKPGCIIEYRYEHLEKNTYDLDPWLIQNSIPVALSYCEINFPVRWFIDYRLIGPVPLNKTNYTEWPVDTTREMQKKIFLLKNIPSFKLEPLMTSVVDNLERIEFALNPNPSLLAMLASNTDKKWQLASERFNFSRRFGMQFKTALPGTERFLDSIKALKTTKEQVNAIYLYVKKQVSWDKHQTLYPYDITETWTSKTGNSADINLIILNLLKKAGIESYPVLISTRENGKTDPAFAHMSQFNGMDVIVFDSTEYYVLDGSSKNPSCFIPPLNVLNRNVFLITTEGYKWVNINENRLLIKDSVYVNATLDKEGVLRGEAITTSFHFSRDLRLTEKDKEAKNTSDLLSNDVADLKTDSAWLLNKEDSMLPLIAHRKFHYSLNTTNNFLFLNSFLFNSFRTNPFKDSTRTTDIDFLCGQQFTQVINILLPKEIVMETIPKSIVIRLADSSMIYSRRMIQRGNVLWVENGFTVSRSVYTPDEYPDVWQFFKKVYELLSEEIVLNKKD